MPTKKPMDMTGQKYGRLLVIGYSHKEGNKYMYNCLCDCSEGMDKRPVIKVNGKQLRDLSSRSCGCLRSEHAQSLPKGKKSKISMELIKQMPCYSKLYEKWNSYWHMVYNPRTGNHKYYGDRGITMCSQWSDKNIGILFFYTWAMQQGFEDGDRIERINKKLGYSPENCRIVKNKPVKNPTKAVSNKLKDKKVKELQSKKQEAATPVTIIKNDVLILTKDNIEIKLSDILEAFGSNNVIDEKLIKQFDNQKEQKSKPNAFMLLIKKLFKSA